jgi:hypothetical protein
VCPNKKWGEKGKTKVPLILPHNYFYKNVSKKSPSSFNLKK